MKNYEEEIIEIFNNDFELKKINGNIISHFNEAYRNGLVFERQTVTLILEINDRILGYSFIFIENRNTFELREHFNNKKIDFEISDLYKISNFILEKIKELRS